MKMRFGLLSVVSFVFFTAGAAAYGDPILYVLYAIDQESAKVGGDVTAGCNQDRVTLDTILNEAFTGERAHRLKRFMMDQPRLNQEGIVDYYTNVLKPTAEDTILFFYCGHGYVADNGIHYFASSAGDIDRSEVRKAMALTSARLKIMISEACSSYPDQTGTVPQRRVPAEWDGLKDLLFGATGLVDITSATPGQFAWGSDFGGLFPQSLFRLFCEKKETLDFDSDGVLTWSEVFAQAYADTRKNFQEAREHAADDADIKKSTTQDPSYAFLAEEPAWTKRVIVRNDTDELMAVSARFMTQDANNNWVWSGVENYGVKSGDEITLGLNGKSAEPASMYWWAYGLDGEIRWGSKSTPITFYPYRTDSTRSDDLFHTIRLR